MTLSVSSAQISRERLGGLKQKFCFPLICSLFCLLGVIVCPLVWVFMSNPLNFESIVSQVISCFDNKSLVAFANTSILASSLSSKELDKRWKIHFDSLVGFTDSEHEQEDCNTPNIYFVRPR